METDLVVVGAGAAGIGAAQSARRRGARVTLVERGPIGGDCTYAGCVPSKTLLEEAARGTGFAGAMSAVHRAIDIVAAAESAPVLREQGINVVQGTARFRDRRTLEVDGTILRPRAFVVATGAAPAVPPIPGLDTVPFLTNENLFNLGELPASMVVLGAGPIGVEMAEAFARLGTSVTLVEATAHILPREEPLAAEVLTHSLRALGVNVSLGAPVTGVAAGERGIGVRVTLGSGRVLAADQLLVAVGRRPFTADLGLDAAGVATDNRGFVTVDSRLRTTTRGIFAAGDVASPLQFTHVAYQTGHLAATNALARLPTHRFNPAHVPWVTFTSPEVARIGLTEAEAVEKGARVVFVPMSEVDRAITSGHTQGFVKIMTGPRPLTRNLAGGRFLGATIVAPRAGEMLHEIVLAMRTGMFPARVALTVHAYPTWSMAVQQATAQLFGEFGGRSSRAASSVAHERVDSKGFIVES